MLLAVKYHSMMLCPCSGMAMLLRGLMTIVPAFTDTLHMLQVVLRGTLPYPMPRYNILADCQPITQTAKQVVSDNGGNP